MSFDLVYNSKNNKLYEASNDGLFVVDCSTDSVIAELPHAYDYSALAYDSLHNLVYCSKADSVYVLDGASDSVVLGLHLGRSAGDIEWVPDLGRMYLAHYKGSSVTVIADSTPAGIHGTTTRLRRAIPTILRARDLPFTDTRILDITGRDVTDSKETLRPGVYFLRDEGGGMTGRGEGGGMKDEQEAWNGVGGPKAEQERARVRKVIVQ